MPVIPSFSAFAPTPDLGGHFSQGFSIVQRAQEAQQGLQMEQQKIAQQQQHAAMEMQVKQQQLQQDMLKDQQDLEIQKAYKETMLGIQQREVKVKEDMLNMSVQKAARSFQANQSYQKEAADMIAAGVDPDKAFMQSALKWGPELDLPGSAYTQGFKSKEEQMPLGGMEDIAGVPPDVARSFVSGKGSRQYVPTQPTGSTSAIPGYTRAGQRMLPERDSIEIRDAKQERNRLQRLQDADTQGQLAKQWVEENPKKELSKGRRISLDRFTERENKIEAFESKIKPSAAPAAKSTPFKDGQKVRDKKTGKLYIVKDGVPQPV